MCIMGKTCKFTQRGMLRITLQCFQAIYRIIYTLPKIAFRRAQMRNLLATIYTREYLQRNIPHPVNFGLIDFQLTTRTLLSIKFSGKDDQIRCFSFVKKNY